MSLIPGNAYEKTIFPDGMQVNVISENTLGAGVHIQGATDGGSIQTGYIGETITWSNAPIPQGFSSGSYVDWSNANIVLTPGIWILYADIQAGCTVSGSQNGSFVIALTDSSNNILEGGLATRSLYYLNNNASALSTYHPLPFHAVVRPTVTTTYKIRAKTAGTWSAYYLINAESDGRSTMFGVRIG
jgi:hypothetical protein